MKHLKRYKAFESVERGHEHSWEDIEDVMLYLKDIGFEYKEDSKTVKFVDSENRKVNLEDAESLVTEFYMTKKGPEDMISRTETPLSLSRNGLYFVKWDDKALEMNEAIASFCAHFDECYYSLSLQFDKWVVGFIIITPVPHDDKSAEREDKIKRKVEEDISNYFNRFRNRILDSFTKDTSRAIGQNKLGETMWGFQGSFKKGFLVCPFNVSNIRNKKLVLTKLDGYSDQIGIDVKVEFREVTAADITKLTEVNPKGTKEYFEERYLGLNAYIIEFDYDKIFTERKEYLLRN
jgi:hypothetical protein